MPMNDTVSIVVPVYNAAACIADTITSVSKQTYTDHELLLVDDSSTDASRDIIEGFLSDKIKLLSNTGPKGAAGARNTGIKAATGRFIAFIDADDLWSPDKLEKQLAFMEENEAAFFIALSMPSETSGRDRYSSGVIARRRASSRALKIRSSGMRPSRKRRRRISAV